MGIFKEIHELRTVGSPDESRELLRKLAIAISRGWVEQIPVMKPRPMAPNETWYRDKETGQIYSLHPFDERPGLWMEIDPKDLIETDDPEEREPAPNGEARVPPLIGILFLKHEVYGREADDLIRAISQLCSQRELQEWWEREIWSQHGQLVLIKARARLAELVKRAMEGGWEMHR
jgi:hypothetical protein